MCISFHKVEFFLLHDRAIWFALKFVTYKIINTHTLQRSSLKKLTSLKEAFTQIKYEAQNSFQNSFTNATNFIKLPRLIESPLKIAFRIL